VSIQKFEAIALTSESTVVAEYQSEVRKEEAYQSETQLESAFVRLLQDQAYEYLPITVEEDLTANLRMQLEALNRFSFTDTEWERFFSESIASSSDTITEKTARIQEDYIRVLKRETGESKNVYLIDKANIHNNRLQVINQYEAEGNYSNRYDVTVLVNGLPMVHIELKRRGVELREAFNQINRYNRDSFWSGSGLYEYVQLFVISNGTLTKYYSNTVRDSRVKESQGSGRKRQSTNSYEFTSWWADANNKPILDLMAFGKTFFAKHTLLNILTRYCVFTSNRELMVMRPYQIVATERILQRIVISENMKSLATVEAGGYVWHTTGSGKTLTSFKTAQLASQMPSVDKVLFVVDRKDLDYQTMKEYNRFQDGAASSNTSTALLKQQLEDPASRIIITTIQKLSRFIESNKDHAVQSKRVVLIFDECHRSQFGDMHTAIRKAFKNYNLFGFTGTPIFASSASSGGNPDLRTTEQAFGAKLHTYTIVDAITDKNVLPFRVDYVNTFKLPEALNDKQVSAIDTEAALLAPERVAKIVDYMLEHFDQKTRRNESYELDKRRVLGFNSLLATQSINAAKAYYLAFKKAQAEKPLDQRLKVATIFSFAANEAEAEETGLTAEEEFETAHLDANSRDFLESAIADYNAMFNMNFSTRSDSENGFENYYKDLAKRLKNRDLDMVIVVNMFLTGFDATTLNTLWVDKNLRQHGLLQAFSRTNRILNSVKTYGNIVCFRDLERQTQEAITLFGNKDAGGVVILAPFADYYSEYSDLVTELQDNFPDFAVPVGEAAQREFVALFNQIMRLRNILVSFDDFNGNEILSPAEQQDYRSKYLETKDVLVGRSVADKESIIQDLVFELELIKQVEINVDYILDLVRKLQDSGVDQAANTEIKASISRAIDSSMSLRSKKDLIESFIASVNVQQGVDVDEAWAQYVSESRIRELEQIIEDEKLEGAATRVFMDQAFRSGLIQTAGTGLSRVMPAVSIFSPSGEHETQRKRVIDKLQSYFDRFFTLGN
jgi:type I restriction enzyme R subunit